MNDEIEEDYPGQADEFRRQELIRKAVQAADRIICDGADGSVEEINWLTVKVAEAFVQKTVIAASSALMRKEMMERQ